MERNRVSFQDPENEGQELIARPLTGTRRPYAITADARLFRQEPDGTWKRCAEYRRTRYSHVTVEKKTRRLHRLVCEAFHGPEPQPGMDAAHNDGDRRNNHANNLRWATRAENIADQWSHGTHWRQRGGKGMRLGLHIEYRDGTKAWQAYKKAQGLPDFVLPDHTAAEKENDAQGRE